MRAITSTGRNVEHLHLMNQAQRGKGVTLQNPRTRICRKQNQQLGKGWHLQTVEDGRDDTQRAEQAGCPVSNWSIHVAQSRVPHPGLAAVSLLVIQLGPASGSKPVQVQKQAGSRFGSISSVHKERHRTHIQNLKAMGGPSGRVLSPMPRVWKRSIVPAAYGFACNSSHSSHNS